MNHLLCSLHQEISKQFLNIVLCLQWSLIANRIKIILGLAVDFYSIQRTLLTGAAAPAIKTRCEMEVDRIDKRFDDCISFLLRVYIPCSLFPLFFLY